MRIVDFAIKDDKAIIAVEIKKGVHKWNKAYGISKSAIKSFDIELFKQQVMQDAQQLIVDQELEDAAMRRIKDFMSAEIILDDIKIGDDLL